jgi:hypothetical protein
MRGVSVTALLIVKNEEHNLRDCLASLSGSVDEVTVVDTGSEDGTVDIARDFGARVLHFRWTGDFAAARNFAITSCTTRWALYIDADERISASSRLPFRHIIQPDWLAADILLRPKTNYTRYRLARLFRIDPRIRFTGAIHETILPSIEQMTGGPASDAVKLTAIEIDHYGYEGDLRSKHLRNLPLLERCIGEFPDRVFYWFHLTETLLGLGRFEEAVAAGESGLEAAGRVPSEKSRVDAAMICQMLSAAMLERASDPRDLLETGLALHPGNYGLQLTKARRELLFGDPAKSLPIARALQSVDPASLAPGLIAYDRDIFGRYAAEMEIASLSRLGRWTEAAQLIAANASRLRG